jgi:hypothetical protein
MSSQTQLTEYEKRILVHELEMIIRQIQNDSNSKFTPLQLLNLSNMVRKMHQDKIKKN